MTAVIQEKTFEGYNRQNRTDCNRLNLTLARLNDIPDGGAVGVSVEIDRGQFHVLIVRLGEDARVYLNSCPHVGVRLDWSPGVFMSIDGALIQCATHGALFEPRTGHCISGPCAGQSLVPVPCEVSEGEVTIRRDAYLPRSARRQLQQ